MAGVTQRAHCDAPPHGLDLMHHKLITTKNSAFQVFQSYRVKRSKRHRDGKIFIEGVIPINSAVTHGMSVDAALIPQAREISDWATGVIKEIRPKTIYRVAEPLLAEISGKENTSELILIGDRPTITPQTAPFSSYKRILLLDRPSSPGNLGTIFRSCDAFGVDCVIIIGHAVDHYDPKTITASRGTVFKIPTLTGFTNAELTALIKQLKTDFQFRVYGTSAKGDSRLDALDFHTRSCIIMGNETTGMSQLCQSLADETVTIPMAGFATSLNIACATSIFLYQFSLNQR